jgi:histidinol phosphatase-like PHP family hydrolase
MFSALTEEVNKLRDGFFQQQEENRRLHKRCDELQNELREMQARLATEHEEFEGRVEAVFSENVLLDHVLVGQTRNNQAIFIHKDADERSERFRQMHYGRFIIESLQYFKNFQQFKFEDWQHAEIIDRYGNIIFKQESFDRPEDFKKLYKVCKDLGIKFVFNGFTTSRNGVTVKIDKDLSWSHSHY